MNSYDSCANVIKLVHESMKIRQIHMDKDSRRVGSTDLEGLSCMTGPDISDIIDDLSIHWQQQRDIDLLSSL